MKKLKTRAVNIVICWNSLRQIPPKDFPTISEMEKLSEILETLAGATPQFVSLIKNGEELRKIMGKPEFLKKQQEFNEKSQQLETERGNEEVVVEFENDYFNTFFQQFERWGKNWFQRVEDYLSFRKSMIETNSAPQK